MSVLPFPTINTQVTSVLVVTPEQPLAGVDSTTPGGSKSEGAASQALLRQGVDGAWLMRTAHAVANHELTRTQSNLGDRYDDLVSWLIEVGLRTALTYDARRSGNDYTFRSYVWDVMERRIPDFYRRKSEGFGDRRRGDDGRVQLAGDWLDEEADGNADFGKRISARRVAEWEEAATLLELSLEDWVLMTLDQYARKCREAA